MGRSRRCWTFACGAFVVAAVLVSASAMTTESLAGTGDESSQAEKSEPVQQWNDEKRVSVAVARERAKLAHNIYAATLDVIHHRYFREDRSTVPARAMEDMFPKIADQENIAARWIAVNAKAMSIDHRPQDDFEKQAAKAIAAGKGEHELVEQGLYRRAEGISLMNKGCLGCHLGFGASGRTKRFAGLVITIPVKTDPVKTD